MTHNTGRNNLSTREITQLKRIYPEMENLHCKATQPARVRRALVRRLNDIKEGKE
jgi:hypothetical protein